MCRVLAYIGPETPLESLLLTPSNSLVNQALDPEHYPLDAVVEGLIHQHGGLSAKETA